MPYDTSGLVPVWVDGEVAKPEPKKTPASKNTPEGKGKKG